jgi:hypothetical protein
MTGGPAAAQVTPPAVPDRPAHCSDISTALEEPLLATASRVRAWLLVEQPGPWGVTALLESRLDRAVAGELARRARAARVRVLLVRRPRETAAGPRRCFAAWTGRGRRWLEAGSLERPEALLELDLDALGRGRTPGLGEPHRAALHLVCTNGRHDRCCAIKGQPLARALAQAPELSGRVWECSHVGGDRFAANLVCLPHGLYFGRLGPADGVRVASAYERGEIDLAHYRGRSSEPWPVQAAEQLLRGELGLTGVDDLVLVRHDGRRQGETVAWFRDRVGRRLEVRLRVDATPRPRPLTCDAAERSTPPAYRLAGVWIRQAP